MGGAWKRVASVGESGVVKDGFNSARFEPVSAKAVRVRVEMREGFSAGVLEARVK